MKDFDIDLVASQGTPNVGWCSPAEISNLLAERFHPWRSGRDPHSLMERVRTLKLDASEVSKGKPIVKVADLPRLFSPDELEAVAGDLDELQGRTLAARWCGRLIGLPSLDVRAVVQLLLRRGVVVQHTDNGPMASVSGCLWLKRLLAAERSLFRGGPDDLVPLHQAVGILRRATLSFLGDDLTLEDEVDRWAEFLGDIRGRRESIDETWREVRTLGLDGWDLFRLTGESTPGMDLEKFRGWLAEAYRQVIGVAPPDVEAAASESVPAPEPGPETARVITRGGRKILVEMA